MSNPTIKETAIVQVVANGKTYTCSGERMMYQGQLVYMFRTRDGLDVDLLLCSDIDPDEHSEFIHVVSTPGGTIHVPTYDPDAPIGTRYLTFTVVGADDSEDLPSQDSGKTEEQKPVEQSGPQSEGGGAKGGEQIDNEGGSDVPNVPVFDDDDIPDPVGVAYISMAIDTANESAGTVIPELNIEYSLDGGFTWEPYTVIGTEFVEDEPTGDVVPIELLEGQSVMIRGINDQLLPEFDPETEDPCPFRFVILALKGYSVEASGDVTSLLNGRGGDVELTPYAFHRMFSGQTITTSPNLPSTTLATACYSGMFEDCEILETAPNLPSTTLVESCYCDMFSGCTSLTTAPELPATTLAVDCYSGMFFCCTSLTSEPELPATTLAESCYDNIFNGCTSLTSAPELPATTLADNCYSNMFKGCTSLTTAPELPATTLAEYCYNSMFYGCSLLENVTCLATDISAEGCTVNWLYNVSKVGTFTRANNSVDWTTGSSGIPEGWEIVDADGSEDE